MSLTKFVPAAVLAAASCAVPCARADLSLEIADLAGRIDYGFYVDDPRAIEAARSVLARMSDDDSAARYYRAFASFRLAQLALRRNAKAADFAQDCVKYVTVGESAERLPRAEAEAKEKASAEAHILLAACEALAAEPEPAQGLELERRGEQALARARAVDPGNPRIALLEAWLVSQRPALAEPELRDAGAAKLAAALEAFAVWSAPVDAPDWGQAEALAALAEVQLTRGETRAARDSIERALLLAPDYQFAVELRSQLQAGRSAAR